MRKMKILKAIDLDTSKNEEFNPGAVMKSTEHHIKDVQMLMTYIANELIKRAYDHDKTKISNRKEFLDHIEYKIMRKTITGETAFKRYHVNNERHHLFDKCPSDVNLIDVIELVCDWVAAGKARSENGEMNLHTLNKIGTDIIEVLLYRAFINTIKLLDDQTEVI